MSATYPGGSATVSQWAVNWGDGSTPDTLPGNTTADTHQYATGGATYLIHVTETDSSGKTYDALLENDVAGGLDPQFDSSATPAGTITGDEGAYSGVAVQPDGSIVAVNPYSATDPIVRYDDTGAPDGTTFASIGAIPNISAVAVQPQGAGFNLVVAGCVNSEEIFTYTLARYNSDGSLDPSFGTNNSTVTVGPWSSLPVKLLVQPDGDIVLVGTKPDLSSGDDLVMARFTPAGQPDPSFGADHDGIATYPLNDCALWCDAVIQPGNRIVVAVALLNGGPSEVLRFTTGGRLDSTFAGGNGNFTTPIVGYPFLATQPDGRIDLTGNNGSDGFALLQYPADGSATPDWAFTTGGYVPTALDVQPGGRILVAGVDSVMGQASWALTAINDDGTPDTAFGGSSATVDGRVFGSAAAMAIDANGDILLAGADNAEATDAVMARFASGGLGLQVSGTTPTIPSSISPLTVNQGQSFNLGPVNFGDPDASETHTANVVWGDGNSDQNATVTEPTTDSNGNPVYGTVSDSYSYATAGTYDSSKGTLLTITNSAGASASESFTVNVVAAQVAIDSFTTDGTNLDVTYTVSGANAAPFNLSLYTSPDGTTPDQPFGTPYAVSGSDLEIGQHTISIAPPTTDIAGDYHLIAVSDANGMNSDGTPVDLAVEFSGGIFTATDTTPTPNQTLVYVFGTPGNDTVTITNSSVELTSSTLTASLSLTGFASVSGIDVRTEDGNNTIAAGGTSIPLWLYGGDGNDTVTGGNGGDTIGVGSGQNVIHEGNGWNSPEIVDDSDAGRAGIDNSFVSGNSWTAGSASQGFNGSEQIHAAAAASTVAATWTFANLDPSAYYEVYVTWSPEAEAATAAQYVVSNGTLPTVPMVPIGQTSIATMNQTQMPIDCAGVPPLGGSDAEEPAEAGTPAGTFWNDLGVFAADGSSTLAVTLHANPSAVVLADAVRLVEYAGPATTNLHIKSFTEDMAGDLWVSYTITGAAAPQFNIGVYGSTNGVQPQQLLQSVAANSADLGPGPYTVPLGLTLADLGSDGYYFAKLDPDDAVEEISKADNIAALTIPNAGTYQDSSGDLYVVTPTGSQTDSVTATQDPTSGNVTITVNGGTAVTYQSVSQIYITLQGNDGYVNAEHVDLPMTIYGGSGSDTITGGDGGNTIYGGLAGGNTIYAGAGEDTIYAGGGVGGGHNTITGGSGGGTIYAGDGGDTITGGTGDDTIYGGAGSDTITGGSGSNTIYCGAGADTVYGGSEDNEIYGGAGYDTLNGSAGQNNWIQAGSGGGGIWGGSGNDWLYGGSSQTLIYGGSGNEVIHGGSGSNVIRGGTGLDEIDGGSGTNFIYGRGVHDVLQGGTGANYILPNSQGNDGLASIQVKDSNDNPTSDGNIDANGNPVVADYDPGYGGTWNFNELDSGVRLGEDSVTPVAVYATWVPSDPNDELQGNHWENEALYTITVGTQKYTVPVDQTASPGNDSPVPNDRPWKLLGVFDVGSSLTVTLGYAGPGGQITGNDGLLCISDVMIQPLWPTVGIRATNVTFNSKVAPANDNDYRDWVDACQGIDVAVDGQGDRVPVQLQASIDTLYTSIQNLANVSMSNWQASVSIDPANSGLELWSSSIGGTALTPAQFNQLIASGNYSGTVWCSLFTGQMSVTNDVSGDATVTADGEAAPDFNGVQLAFQGPSNAKVKSSNVTTTPQSAFHNLTVQQIRFGGTKTASTDVGEISLIGDQGTNQKLAETVQGKVNAIFDKNYGTTPSTRDWTVTYAFPIVASDFGKSEGESNIAIAVRLKTKPTTDANHPIDFSGTDVRILCFYWVKKTSPDRGIILPDQQVLPRSITLSTAEHERWHVDGIPAKSERFKQIQLEARKKGWILNRNEGIAPYLARQAANLRAAARTLKAPGGGVVINQAWCDEKTKILINSELLSRMPNAIHAGAWHEGRLATLDGVAYYRWLGSLTSRAPVILKP